MFNFDINGITQDDSYMTSDIYMRTYGITLKYIIKSDLE